MMSQLEKFRLSLRGVGIRGLGMELASFQNHVSIIWGARERGTQAFKMNQFKKVIKQKTSN